MVLMVCRVSAPIYLCSPWGRVPYVQVRIDTYIPSYVMCMMHAWGAQVKGKCRCFIFYGTFPVRVAVLLSHYHKLTKADGCCDLTDSSTDSTRSMFRSCVQCSVMLLRFFKKILHLFVI